MSFAKPQVGNRSADRRGWSSEAQEAAYRKGQRLGYLAQDTGAHPGGNLRG